MIIFFDRSAGRKMGYALKGIRKFPYRLELHHEYFAPKERDDVWLAQVGQWGWMVIGQDYKHHEIAAELDAIVKHQVGAFYHWGSQEPQWEIFKVLVKSLDKMVALAEVTPRPFVFRVEKSGQIKAVRLPGASTRAQSNG